MCILFMQLCWLSLVVPTIFLDFFYHNRNRNYVFHQMLTSQANRVNIMIEIKYFFKNQK